MNKPSNKDIAELLRASFADAAPDKAQEIIKAAKAHNSAPTVSVIQENLRGKYLKSAALIAAAIVIVFCIIYIPITVRSSEPYSTVLIESDACVEIDLNRDRRPVSVRGMDSAAAQLAKRIEKGATLEEAVDHTLDAMRDSGSLSEDSNTVLITADAPENPEELLQASFEAAKESFDGDGYSGAILTTVASDDKDIRRMARRYRISIGKAEMITDILKEDRSFRTDLLCRLSVNDLNLLTSHKRILYNHIEVFGVSRGCIDPDEAIGYVSARAGFTDPNAEAALDVDSYGLIYSVTVRSDEKVAIYRLDAANGDIIAVSEGADLRTAQMADRNTPSPSPTEKKSDPTAAATEKPHTPVTVLTNTPDNSTVPTEAPKTAPTAPKATAAKPTTPPTQKPTEKPKPAPTQPKPTQKPTEKPKPTQKPTEAPKPTQPPKTDPAIFTSDSYLTYTGGVQSGSPLSDGARQIGVRRIINGYNIFYDNTDFPYSPAGKQGGISALVCNREQFYRLTGKTDSRFDDSYFASHALYIHMNRDANYHWIKSVAGAYMDGGTLCIENNEPVGYYITADADNPERIYTVVYELNKADLSDFIGMVEFTE